MTENGDLAMTRYGDLEQTRDGRWQLRFERRLSHDVETVWQAVTEPEHLAAWFPTTIDGERVAGARLRFTFPGAEAEPMDGVMLAFDPMSLMELQWGPDTVRIELEPVSSGTLLRLLAVLEDRGKGARDGAGWHACLDALSSHVDGAPAESARGAMEGWRDVRDHYIDAFGPEASTIGPPAGME